MNFPLGKASGSPLSFSFFLSFSLSIIRCLSAFLDVIIVMTFRLGNRFQRQSLFFPSHIPRPLTTDTRRRSHYLSLFPLI